VEVEELKETLIKKCKEHYCIKKENEKKIKNVEIENKKLIEEKVDNELMR